MQTIDLSNSTMEGLRIQVGTVAARIKQQKAQRYLIAGTLVLAILALGGKA